MRSIEWASVIVLSCALFAGCSGDSDFGGKSADAKAKPTPKPEVEEAAAEGDEEQIDGPSADDVNCTLSISPKKVMPGDEATVTLKVYGDVKKARLADAEVALEGDRYVKKIVVDEIETIKASVKDGFGRSGTCEARLLVREKVSKKYDEAYTIVSNVMYAVAQDLGDNGGDTKEVLTSVDLSDGGTFFASGFAGFYFYRGNDHVACPATLQLHFRDKDEKTMEPGFNLADVTAATKIPDGARTAWVGFVDKGGWYHDNSTTRGCAFKLTVETTVYK